MTDAIARLRPQDVGGLAVYRRHPAEGTELPAPRVVYVHGALDRAASFIRAVRCRPGIDAVRYDRRGYGRSGGAGFARTIGDHVDDLLAVIGDQRSVVAGHSLGGVIALAAAIRSPATIGAVVAFEAPLWAGDDGTSSAVRDRADEEARADPAMAAERFLRRMIGDEAWEALPESTRATRRAEGPALVGDLAAVRAVGGTLLDTPIPVPVVAGYGSATSERHRAGARHLHERAPGSDLVVVDGAGHDAHRTHPEAFAAIVDRAIARAGTA